MDDTHAPVLVSIQKAPSPDQPAGRTAARSFSAIPNTHFYGGELRDGEGVDDDSALDGWYDRDELDLGSDPADPASFPGASGTGYCFGDGSSTA